MGATFNQKYVVAVIPARGGSKRLPGKNLKEIKDGVSLLKYAIQKLLRVKYIDEIIVTTEDTKIMEHVFGMDGRLTVVQRDEELARDDVFIFPVIRDALKRFPKYLTGYILVHQCDNPTTTVKDFERALEKLQDTQQDVVITVSSTGVQNGAIRALKGEVINRMALEHTTAIMRLEFPYIDIHTAVNLQEAKSDVRVIEAVEALSEIILPARK